MNKTETSSRIVMFLATAVHLGGAERSLLEIVTDLNDPSKGFKWSPIVIVPKGEGLLIEELNKRRIPHQLLKMPDSIFKLSRGDNPLQSIGRLLFAIPTLIRYLNALIQLISKINPQLIHTTGVKCHLLGAIAGKLSRTPTLWHIRDIFKTNWILVLLKTIRWVSDTHCIFNSIATAQAFLGPGDWTPQIIYNGIAPETYQYTGDKTMRRQFNIPDEAYVVGCIGAFARWKGQLEFLQMARKLLDRGMNAYFLLVGAEIYDTGTDPGFTSTIQAKAIELGLGNRLIFTGFQSNVVNVMNSLDIIVHASIAPEPFGRVLIEALACKIPVVCTSHGGAVEIITHQKTGYWVTPGNIKEMADAVQHIHDHPSEKASLVSDGYQDFLRRFSQKTTISRLVQTFETIT